MYKPSNTRRSTKKVRKSAFHIDFVTVLLIYPLFSISCSTPKNTELSIFQYTVTCVLKRFMTIFLKPGKTLGLHNIASLLELAFSLYLKILFFSSLCSFKCSKFSKDYML